uniref:Uncharacterized protein n=1 Tax=Acrobeloides nanus TaxID=290746 RepID=A0A914D5S2_9BILA
MMKLKFDTTIALSHRYQLAENLRVVQIMTPVIFVGTAFDIAATFGVFLQTSIDYNTQLTFPSYLFVSSSCVQACQKM